MKERCLYLSHQISRVIVGNGDANFNFSFVLSTHTSYILFKLIVDKIVLDGISSLELTILLQIKKSWNPKHK